MKLEEITAYTEKCFCGEPATCSFACPFHLDIRSFLSKLAKGRWAAAYKTYRGAVVFPVLVSKLCDHPCRERCQRANIGDEPIDMGALEAACLKYAKNPKPERYTIPPKEQSVAVVGAGPSGLSCALNLALKKYKVTVFDRENGWGGSLRSRPDFPELDADFTLQFSGVNVDFKFSSEIRSLDELEGFDAIYVATGRGGNDFGLLPTWDEQLLTTSDKRVFMGGELCGKSVLTGIFEGAELARQLEVYFQTGKAERGSSEFDMTGCGHVVDHSGEARAALVHVDSEETAMAEAARCMQCDCTACIDNCEMLEHFRKKPKKLSVEVYTDSRANPPIATHSMTREAYSCNDCGHCKAICPVGVDMGALLRLSRELRTEDVHYPRALHDYWLKEMAFHTGEAAFSYVPDNCKYIFFPGCRLTASYSGHVEQAFKLLSDRYSTGIALGCCGAPAFWAGEKKLFEENMEQIRELWRSAGKPCFVFACATCESLFERYFPEADRVSLYSLLEPSDVKARKSGSAAVFDPCAARDDPDTRATVRALAETAGLELSELAEPGRCCGYGGQMMVANRKLYDKITANRAEASPLPYVVYCANCREVFAARGKEATHILDLVFDAEPGAVPSIEQKRESSLQLKDKLSRELTGTGFTPSSRPWSDVKLTISPEVQAMMDDSLISADDVREVIWNAQKDGTGFASGDRLLACLVTETLTYWVEYQPEADGFIVHDAYAHRMKFRQEV